MMLFPNAISVLVGCFCANSVGKVASFTLTRLTQQQLTGPNSILLETVPGADIEKEVSSSPQLVGDRVFYRGKVNEIDYCIAPADVSLSRLIAEDSGAPTAAVESSELGGSGGSGQQLSMTRYLNNASNRAVRRILLARCWPSEEALNLSLRIAAAAEKEAAERAKEASSTGGKCPVPRPILNMIMRKESSGGGQGGTPLASKGPRTSEQYVADQINSFRENYGSLPGYDYAESYLETILNLATNGNEPSSVKNVMESGVYDESYKRIRAVLKSVGAIFEEIPNTESRYRIAKKLKDQDFCLSIVDQIQMKNEGAGVGRKENGDKDADDKSPEQEVEQEVSDLTSNNDNEKKKLLPRLRFWKKDGSPETESSNDNDSAQAVSATEDKTKDKDRSSTGIFLSADEPTMTRQLNALANIVERALQYGGDQELLVLSETLFSNRDEFVQRWYSGTGVPSEEMKDETRPGVQFLNALVLLLREAYDNGVVTSLDPATTLIPSFSNAYERLMATLVETGSGYVRPEVSANMKSMPKPRTAQEELGRFAVWEANFRSTGGETASYPEDLAGSWEVEDLVGGERIGVSTVILEPQGEVNVAPPLQGLRWRLDPGPTHLDTCTFQVLSDEGTVLQYRGFIDRGARVESRFSGRSTKIRGSVMFQMRGDVAGMGDDYWKDMLPVNYKIGTTKFVMTKKAEAKET